MPQIEQGLKLIKSWLSKMKEAQNAFKKLGNRLKAGVETTKPTQYTAVLKNPQEVKPALVVIKEAKTVADLAGTKSAIKYLAPFAGQTEKELVEAVNQFAKNTKTAPKVNDVYKPTYDIMYQAPQNRYRKENP